MTSWFHIFYWLKNMLYLNFTFKNDRIMCTWFYRLLRPPSLRIWKINRNRSSSINIYLKDKLILTVKDWNSIPWITIPRVYPRYQALLEAHIVKIKIDQNRKTRLQILDIWCKNVRKKSRDLKKKFWPMAFFVNPG